MKKCPWCGKEYPDDASACAIDKSPLERRDPISTSDGNGGADVSGQKSKGRSGSPQRLKHSVGRPFWGGCCVGPIFFLLLLAALGVLQSSSDVLLFTGVAIVVFGPIGGAVSQAVHDLFVAGRLRMLHLWDALVFAAIIVALVVAGEALFHTSGRQADIDAFGNHTFDAAGVFIIVMLCIYAISKNLTDLSSRQTWMAVLSTVGLLGICVGIYKLTGFDPGLLLVPGIALWAAIDSSQIHLKRYESGISYGPVVVFFGVMLLWFLLFPWYLVVRHKIKSGRAILKDEAKQVA